MNDKTNTTQWLIEPELRYETPADFDRSQKVAAYARDTNLQEYGVALHCTSIIHDTVACMLLAYFKDNYKNHKVSETEVIPTASPKQFKEWGVIKYTKLEETT